MLRPLLPLLITVSAAAQNYDKAVVLLEHGLTKEAKLELIEVAFAGDKAAQPKALFLLGSIAMREGDATVAQKRWADVQRRFPESPEAKLAATKTKELSALLPHSRRLIKDPVALTYLRNGDFWSRGKETQLRVARHWIPNITTAIKWYDKVIEDFPKSPAAEAAYVGKIQTLVGWLGIKDQTPETKLQSGKYMDQAAKTFRQLAKAFPKSTALQGLRFQIAQKYWRMQLPHEAEDWLRRVVRSAGKGDDFFRELAMRWLQRMRYRP